jgi:hypothetical protein
MPFPVEVINLALYCVQQLGIVLGVGAETIVLIVYFLSMRDGRVEQKEEQFGHAVHRVLRWGLGLIISSGALITAVHVLLGQTEIISQPAFIMKWILVGAVLGMEAARRKQLFAHYGWEGTAAAQWYALFILHILAPVATWADLLILYCIWFAGFTAMFVSLVHVLGVPVPGYVALKPQEQKPQPPAPKPAPKPVAKQEPKKAPPPPHPRPAPVVHKPAPPVPQPKPKPIPPATPPAPKPVPLPKEEPMLPKPGPMPPPPAVIAPSMSLPAVAMKPPVKPPMPIPQKPKLVIPPLPRKPHNQIPIPRKPQPMAVPKKEYDMPAIRIMPQTEQDVDKQFRPAQVQLPKH